MPKTLIISYSEIDQTLADAFVNLLSARFEFGTQDLFCSGHRQFGIKAGDDPVEEILKRLKEPSALISLVSENSKSSAWCSVEVGAAWALDRKNFAILTGDTKWADVVGPKMARAATTTPSSRSVIELLLDDLGDKVKSPMDT